MGRGGESLHKDQRLSIEDILLLKDFGCDPAELFVFFLDFLDFPRVLTILFKIIQEFLEVIRNLAESPLNDFDYCLFQIWRGWGQEVAANYFLAEASYEFVARVSCFSFVFIESG